MTDHMVKPLQLPQLIVHCGDTCGAGRGQTGTRRNGHRHGCEETAKWLCPDWFDSSIAVSNGAQKVFNLGALGSPAPGSNQL